MMATCDVIIFLMLLCVLYIMFINFFHLSTVNIIIHFREGVNNFLKLLRWNFPPVGQVRGARVRLSYCSRQKKEDSEDEEAVKKKETSYGSCEEALLNLTITVGQVINDRACQVRYM